MPTNSAVRDPMRTALAAVLRHLNAERELLSEPQVLERLRIGRTTWWRWRARGYAPAPVIRQGRVVRWRASDIDALLGGTE